MNIDPALIFQLVVLALGALALFAVWSVGFLRRSALADAPPRKTGLHPLDLLVVIVLMGVGAGAAFALLGYMLGGPPVVGAMTTLEQAGMVLVYQAFAQGLPAAYVLVRVIWANGGMRGVRVLGFNLHRAWRQLWLTVFALIAGLPMLMALGVLVLWLAAWLGLWVPEIGHDLLLVIQEADSLAGMVVLMLSVVVVAAVLEELIYRGLVQSALLRMLGEGWRWLAVLIASGLFTFMHIGLGTFDPEGEGGVTWNALPTLFALAVILGWLYERTGSLWPPIVVHAGFNAFNVAMVMLLYG